MHIERLVFLFSCQRRPILLHYRARCHERISPFRAFSGFLPVPFIVLGMLAHTPNNFLHNSVQCQGGMAMLSAYSGCYP